PTYLSTLSLHDALPIYGAYFQRIALFNDLNGRIDFAVQGHGLIKDGAPLYRWLELLTNPATPRRTLRLGTGRTQGSDPGFGQNRSEEHTSELQSRSDLV